MVEYEILEENIMIEIYVKDYLEEDGDPELWEKFGSYPTLVIFDRDNLKKNKRNLLMYLEYQKFHMFGLVHLLDLNLKKTEEWNTPCLFELCNDPLFSFIFISTLQEYVYRNEYETPVIINDYELSVVFKGIEPKELYDSVIGTYYIFKEYLKKNNQSEMLWYADSKYQWYLRKIDYHNLPKEPLQSCLDQMKGFIEKYMKESCEE